MKKNKFLSLILALTVLISVFAYLPVSAADAVIETPTVNDDTAVVTVSGTVDGAKKGDSLSVFIAKEGVAVSDASAWTKTNFLTNLTAFVQTVTDKDGKYSAELSMLGSELGDYKIYISAKGETYEFPFFFADKESKKRFISEVADIIEDGKTATALEEKLSLSGADSPVAKTFGILDGNKILVVDKTNLASILHSILTEKEKENEGSVRAMEPSEFVSAMSLAAAIETVNDGSVNITEYETLLGLSKDFMATYKKYVDAEKFTAYTKDKSIKSVKEASDLFKSAVIEAVLNDASGWSVYLELIDTHGEYLELDMITYQKIIKKENITDYLKGTYTDTNTFKIAANSAIKKAYAAQNSGSSGSSSGGGGGGGGAYSPKPSATAGGNLSTPTVPLDKMTAEPAFSDVADSYWGKEAIVELAKRGILSGTGGGAFEPDRSVTREEFVKIIVLALGLVPSSGDTSFADVAGDAWYKGYIAAAVQAGIVNGISENEFGVGKPVSRQDAATMIYRAALKIGEKYNVSEELFTDDASIAEYAKQAVYALKGAGIINGTGEGVFDAASSCSRGQTAKMVYEYIKKGEAN